MSTAPTSTIPGSRIGRIARTAAVLVRAGVVRPGRPDRTFRQLAALRRWGPTFAGGYAAAAARSPTAVSCVDETGPSTFVQVDAQSTRLAHGLAAHGAGPGAPVGVLCRNHALSIRTLVACGKLGADAVLLNTGLAAPQLRTALHDMRVTVLVADAEFGELCAQVPEQVTRITAWEGNGAEGPTVEGLTADSPGTSLTPPERPGRLIVLTSGTTGPSKGARRPTPRGPQDAAAVLSRIPMRTGDRILVAAPVFHTWGLAGVQLAMSLRSPVVLERRFDPEAILRTIERHRCTALIAVPVMLQRVMELPAGVRARYDTSSLRIAACSGSAMGPRLVTEFMDAFGDIVYNLYGSTEVSWATIATPGELRATPTTAGRPPLGTRLAVLDEHGQQVPPGTEGSVFVGNDMLFEGYTSGHGRRVRHGLMETGDRGRLDGDGLLHVAGRDDDMIVSGGENLFPRPVEEAIAMLPQVREVAVVGVPDAEFGQRFAAYVVVDRRAELDEDAVRYHVRSRLSRFSVPRDVHFLDELPRNATGKILAKDLGRPLDH